MDRTQPLTRVTSDPRDLPAVATTQDNTPTRTFDVPIAGHAGGMRTSALTLDEIVDEARRRLQLYRSSNNAGDYRARAEAVEAFMHWIEASR